MISIEAAQNILKKISQIKVLVIGDLILDRYVVGNVDRISPEAPIPIMKINSHFEIPGGAGNVARNLDSLGVKTNFISTVGKDSSGKKLIKSINSTKNIYSNIVTNLNRQTTIKTRYIGNNQQLLRTDDETVSELSKGEKTKILKYFSSAIKKSDIVILSDYGKGVFVGGFCKNLIKLATKHKKKIIVDPKNKDFSVYKGCYCITPNIKEAFIATNIYAKNNLSSEKCGLHIVNNNWSKNVLLTRGKKGLSIINRSYKRHFKANAEEVYDVSGAGDTVVASFSACIAAKIDIHSAAEFANLVASIVVKKSGAAIVKKDDIFSKIEQNTKINSETKIFTTNKIKSRISYWRKKGLKIGFTNGCFDIIHSGHIQTLQEASSVCDKLVVAVNSDKSVKMLKGKDRPIQNQTSRMQILSALSSVDAVVLFNENTPIKLIKMLKPDYLIKGSDYKKDDIVGSNVLSGWGGKVYRSKFIKSKSTSKIISDITNASRYE